MRRADLLFSVFLIALGSVVTVESWRMPRLAELGVHPMTAPGLTPGLIGVVLTLLGTALLLRSIGKRGAATTSPSHAPHGTAPSGYARVLVVLALTIGYAAGLVGWLPFWLATAIFVAAFILTFERRPGQGLGKRIITAVVMAAVVSFVVTGLFQGVFLVQLP